MPENYREISLLNTTLKPITQLVTILPGEIIASGKNRDSDVTAPVKIRYKLYGK